MTQPAIYLRSGNIFFRFLFYFERGSISTIALNSSADPALATALAAFVSSAFIWVFLAFFVAHIVKHSFQSPDIIPLDQVQATPEQLASAYNDFIAHAIDLDEPTTAIYIRGKQNSAPAPPPSRLSFFSMLGKENNKTVASIRAVPNELILWPQVWETANVIGHTELDYTGNKQGKGAFFIRKLTRLSTLQWSPAAHQSSTLIFRLKKVTVTLLLLLLVPPKMQPSLYRRSRTGAILSNMSARTPLWHSITFRLQTLVLVMLNLRRNLD